MNLASRLKPYNTPLTLVAGILLLGILTQLLGIPLLIRIITVMFVSLILVLGLQLYMGNSGILSFAHIGFMGIGAYTSVLFSMTPAAKEMTNPDMYPVLIPLHLPFLPSLLIGALTAAFIAAVIGYPLMRLSDAAAVITTFALLVITHVVLVHWDPVSNGPRTLFGVNNYTNLWISVVFCIITIFAVYLFKESRVGLRLRATPRRCLRCGLDRHQHGGDALAGLHRQRLYRRGRRGALGALHHFLLPLFLLPDRDIRDPGHAGDRRTVQRLRGGGWDAGRDRRHARFCAPLRITSTSCRSSPRASLALPRWSWRSS